MTIRSNRTSIAGAAWRFATLSFLLFACAGRSTMNEPKANPGSGLRVLFIGNSLTYANDLPQIVQALAKAAGDNLYVESATLGGASLEDLWKDGKAQKAISRKKWDVVVLQQGPTSLPESRAQLRKSTKLFAEVIRKAGGRPALYMVWPGRKRDAFFDDVRESYSLAAKDVDGIFLPAGEAFRAAWRRDPKLRLYSRDDFHPSEAGSYAAALSIYGVLYNRPLQGLPARLTLANRRVINVPPALAKLLQEAATEANKAYGRP